LQAHAGQFDLIQSHERIPGMPIYRAGDGVHAQWLRLRAAQGGVRARATSQVATWLNPYHRYMVERERLMFTHPALRMVICNSKMVRAEIAREFAIDPAKLEVVYNGVDVDAFYPPNADERATARASFRLPAGAPTFLYVGSGFARKGVATLLDAFATLPREAQLLIVGADKAQARFIAAAQRLGLAGRVQFLGGLAAHVAMLRAYHAADAFVLPTIYDPMPNVVPEALACGLPVVTTTDCGGAELLDPAIGSVVPSGNPQALAAALQHWLTPSPMIRTAARGAATRIAAPQQARALLALYARLLENSGLPINQ
jgi:UDP-glucose:(heptosyl)LPS alpha-1,3-glucosyltransferase